MIYLRLSLNSWSLGRKTNLNILLPDCGPGQTPPPGGYQSLYLLHGYTGDESDWMRMSCIEHLMMGREVAVIMPDGGKGFYTNTKAGDDYWTFVSQELPALVGGCFPVSQKRQDTFVVGLSMGGYGAVKLALCHPERFACAVSFSGVLDAAALMEEIKKKPKMLPHCSVPPNFETIFGGRRQFEGSQNDLFALLEETSPERVPKLMLYCGTEDFLISANKKFADAATQKGVSCSLDCFEGGHDWFFWNAALEKALDQLSFRKA